MRRAVEIPIPSVVPGCDAVARAMGGTAEHAVEGRVAHILEEALGEFRTVAEPRGIMSDVGVDEFATIHEGDGDNASPSPLQEIFPKADALILFAVTVGAAISDRTAALFDAGEYALGAALDAAGSEGAELAAVHLDGLALDEAARMGLAGTDKRLLRYSPGYCGWNITGQRALFAALAPEEIGIGLTDSCLMEPLKSISGVMVMGPAEIHDFKDDYDFCSDCRTRDCRRRTGNPTSSEPQGEQHGDPGADRR